MEHFAAANEACVLDDCERASNLYEAALKSEPENPRILVAYAACKIKQGQISEALQFCDSALQKARENQFALYWKGVALFYKGSFFESRDVFESMNCTDKVSMWIRKCDSEEPRKLNKVVSGRVSYGWHQSESLVEIVVPLKEYGKEPQVVIGEREVSVTFEDKSKEFHFAIDLFDKIKKDSCSWKVSNGDLLIKLYKQTNVEWKSLEHKQESKASYPTSSKVKKDWSKIDRQCDAELRAEKDAGEGALNKFFQEIYGNADEDTRRAMIKSFQTSGGTVLSTNWSEVKKADYEGKDRPEPPQGQEWRK